MEAAENSGWGHELWAETEPGDFTGSPVVKTLLSSVEGVGLIPGGEAKIPYASWPKNQNIKLKQYCNKFKTLKKWSILKKKSLKKKKTEPGVPDLTLALWLG